MNQKRLYFGDTNIENFSYNETTVHDDKLFIRIKEEKKFSSAKLFLFIISTSIIASLFSVLLKIFHS